jgi:hypothetical protein
MAIKHKRKNSAGYAWQTGDLVEGQIGLNIADGTAHIRKADGTIATIGSGGGSSSLPVAVAYASTSLTVTTKRLNWNSEQSDINSLITVGSDGTFTISNAGTYLIELASIISHGDRNDWRLYNHTGNASLKSFTPAEASSGGYAIVGGWAHIHVITASNAYRWECPNTGVSSVTGTPILKVTKLA